MSTGRLVALILVVGTVAVILFANVINYSPVNHTPSPTSVTYSATIVGTYQCVPNPCTTDPCLPGMVWAVAVEDTPYILTVDGSWIWDCAEKSWDGYKPAWGDTVQVTGKVTEREDVRGTSFCEIEVDSLREAWSEETQTTGEVGKFVLCGKYEGGWKC